MSDAGTGFANRAVVIVVGISAGGRLGDEAQAALARAGLVVGSRSNLELPDVPLGVERLELGPLEPAIERLRDHVGTAVVLAGGDPGFFGIARALREAGLRPHVVPGVSSVAAVAAHAGLAWDAAVVVSAHGRDLEPALNACRRYPVVAVLTGPGAGPVEIARGLAGRRRELVIAERLGLPGERITREDAEIVAKARPSEFADLNVVLCLDSRHASTRRADNQPAAAPVDGWALDETSYEHRDSMITKAEVRAYVVARLRPRLGRSVWDVGAGSGSVGIECALLGAAVTCVDRDAAACAMITANATRHGVDVRVVEGVAPESLEGLGEADSVFLGGGGVDVLAWVAARRVPVVVAAYAALDRAVHAHRTLTGAGYAVRGSQLSAARLAGLPGGSLRLAATNPVIVLVADRAGERA